MRYVTLSKNGSFDVVVWAKSQFRDAKNRECSHRDYLRNNQIPFENAVSIGEVHYNPKTGESNIQALPWDNIQKNDDPFLVQKAVVSFYKQHPELKDEIQADWDQYQAWLKRSKEILGRI